MMKIKLVPEIGRVGSEFILPLSPEQEKRAMKLHKESIVFDLHLHPVVMAANMEEDLDKWISSMRYPTGYVGIKHAGIDAYIEGFGSMPHTWTMDDAIKEIGLRWCDMDHNYDKVIRGLRAEDVYKAKKEGKTAIFMSIENSELIGNVLDNIDLLYGIGLRAMGLCYNKRNLVGDGRIERTNTGLSNFGLKVIERINKLGMIIDTAHAGEQTTIEALEASSDPIIISHSGARSVFDTRRLATDEELEALKRNGGLIGMHTGVNLLSDAKHQGVETTIDHIDYCVKAIGIDHVCIGSDNYFGDKKAMHRGLISKHPQDGPQGYLKFNADYMEGIENPSEWKNITRALVKRGYSDDDIKKLIGGNTLKLVETVVG